MGGKHLVGLFGFARASSSSLIPAFEIPIVPLEPESSIKPFSIRNLRISLVFSSLKPNSSPVIETLNRLCPDPAEIS